MAWVLQRTTLSGGHYRGLLHNEEGAAEAPSLQAHHDGQALDGVSVEPVEGVEGQFSVSIPLPSYLMADDVQTVLIRDTASDEVLDTVVVIAGLTPADDVRAELDVLRAELDILKRAFRRQMRG